MNHYYNSNPDRSELAAKISGTIIDIGGAHPSTKQANAVLDFNLPWYPTKWFKGNMNLPEVWQEIFYHVKKNGKFEWAICTHTLEDISNPLFVAQCMEKIAKQGLIIVPSKYIESGRMGNFYRGFIHHRWIWNVEDGKLTGYPKINYFEHPKFDGLNSQAEKSELVYWWEGRVNMQLVNDDFLGPDNASVEGYYDRLLND
jgi:hypothetical protein